MESDSDNKKGLISIIVPVYNAGAWLNDALDSLRAQSYGIFEAILIDDGSTDNSPAVCKEFARNDSRFRYIRQDNAGVSAARNKGIDLARGEWITFLDADDKLLPHALGTFIKSAEETGCLISAGLFSHKEPDKEDFSNYNRQVVSSEDAIRIGLYQKRILNSPWGMIYHRSVFDSPERLRFRKCRYEDLDLFYRAFERVPEICLIDSIVYFYRDHPSSFINTWSESRLDALYVTDRIVEHMKAHHPNLTEAALDRRFSAHCNILAEITRRGIKNTEARDRCIRVIRERRLAELRDPEVRIKNKLGALASYVMIPIIKLLCR